jgi:chromosomal replication initiation ATPase DnaA
MMFFNIGGKSPWINYIAFGRPRGRTSVLKWTGLSFHAWIDVIVPLALSNDVLVLEVPTPDIQKTLEDFYFENLRDAVRAANETIFGHQDRAAEETRYLHQPHQRRAD